LIQTLAEVSEPESTCAILEVTPELLDWLRVRVSRTLSLAEEFKGGVTLTLPFPFQLDVYVNMPDEALRLQVEEGALDNCWMECTTQVLDNISDTPEEIGCQSVRIRSTGIAIRFLEIEFAYELSYSNYEEYTHPIIWKHLDALYPQACLDVA
jgi:hypothetical protein